MRIFKTFILTLFIFPAYAGRINPATTPFCLLKSLSNQIPDLEGRDYNVNNRIKKFVNAVKSDYSITMNDPHKQYDNHWEKHRESFLEIGIHFRNEVDRLSAARNFSEGVRKSVIVFKNSLNQIIKADFETNEILILNANNNRLITYFRYSEKVSPYSNLLEHIMERLFYDNKFK